MARTIPKQLSFTFDEPPAPPRQQVVVVLEGEALPSVVRPSAVAVVTEPVAAETYSPSDGQRENAYLLHRISKFEDRANAALKSALLLSLLAVLAKGGVPLSTALLERMNLPGVGDGQLLTGLLAIVTVILAGAAAYYVFQIRHHSSQMQIPTLRRTLAGDIAQAMLTFGTILSVMVVIGVASLCFGDMIYAVLTLRDHLVYRMTGWEPYVIRP